MPTGAGTLKLVWGSQSELDSAFANQVQVIRTQSEVYLVFGEGVPPNVVDLSEESLSHIVIRPVSRIVLPISAFEVIARVIARSGGVIDASDGDEGEV